MGQTTSIIEYPFDDVNRMISRSTVFQSECWTNSIDQNKRVATYKLPSNKAVTVTIAETEWPTQKDQRQLTQGHHYYHINVSGKTYHYDADRDEWVGDQPPEKFDELAHKV